MYATTHLIRRTNNKQVKRNKHKRFEVIKANNLLGCHQIDVKKSLKTQSRILELRKQDL